jgi:cell division cycle 14
MRWKGALVVVRAAVEKNTGSSILNSGDPVMDRYSTTSTTSIKSCDAAEQNSGTPRGKSDPVNDWGFQRSASLFERKKVASAPLNTPPLDIVKFQLAQVYDLVPGVLGFACFKNKKQMLTFSKHSSPKLHFFTSEFHCEYVPVGAECGPVDIEVIYKFCGLVQSTLDKDTKKQSIYYFLEDPAELVNSFLLLGCFCIAHRGFSGENAYHAFRRLRPCPFPAYRDSGQIGKKSTFDITLQDCLYGFYRAQRNGWLGANAQIQLAHYVSWKQEGLGDFHYVSPRLVSFRGPTAVRQMICPGLFTCLPIDYCQIFLKHNVSCVVRINSPDNYHTKNLKHAQIRVRNLETADEDLPTQEFVASVLKILTEEQGTVVLHSKYGIQSTGLLFCMHLVMEEVNNLRSQRISRVWKRSDL